ncbi:hypothetical protein H920_17708 [Fukomys damarensis]|uniref:Uncharacterized protein n=1 Tax=Fukomys damarensis TaxID=885580 RepID=A0A091CTM4_FUKDA|nr:hypothetical protein H920_17708 [Fukomys damarensis]
MASNMDREIILADFQVKYLALFLSHLQTLSNTLAAVLLYKFYDTGLLPWTFKVSYASELLFEAEFSITLLCCLTETKISSRKRMVECAHRNGISDAVYDDVD